MDYADDEYILLFDEEEMHIDRPLAFGALFVFTAICLSFAWTTMHFKRDAYTKTASVSATVPIVSATVPATVPATVTETTTAPQEHGRKWRVPRDIVSGILFIESRSYLDDDDRIVYVDRQRGAYGEVGPTQITKAAFDMVKNKGENFYSLQTDMEFCIDVTERYLLFLQERTRDWDTSIRAYHRGLNGTKKTSAWRYMRAVNASGQK